MGMTFYVVADVDFMGQRSQLEYHVLADDEADALATANKDLVSLIGGCSSGRIHSVKVVQ